LNAEEKKAAIAAYKMTATEYGVIQIENTINHKRFVKAVPNIKNRWDYYQLSLARGAYHDTDLQHDWDTLGAQAFTYTVLWHHKTDDIPNLRQAVKELQAKWNAKIRPEY
jgi:hypothetical protein